MRTANDKETIMDMNGLDKNVLGRRALMQRGLNGGLGFAALMMLPACASIPGYGLTDAIERLLVLSSNRAFARLTAANGFWDQQVEQIGLSRLLGTRGDILSSILTSALFKNRLEDAFADVAIKGSERAAPIVLDAVRTIGFANAVDLVRGGPKAATTALRGELGGRLIEDMVPELGEAIRIASDPLVGQLINAATGTNIGGIARNLAGNVDDAIWNEMGVEEAAIRANPRETGDPVLIGVFGVGKAL
jgi:hypothetical protein